MSTRYTFTALLWQWQARRDGWFFVSVPDDISEEIAARNEGLTAGFNSVPVRVQVGSTNWRTSIFPGGDGRYSLPMKKAVRVAERIDRGSQVNVTIDLEFRAREGAARPEL